MKIGLLEDNPGTLDYLQDVLKLAGHSVTTHTHGASLLDALFTEGNVTDTLPYDILLVDLLLPGNLSGLEVINRVRQILSPERLPIIVVSAAASQWELERIQVNFPTIKIVSKPFKFRSLLELIESYNL